VPRLIVLLRGVNLASRNRVAMPALREALAESGFADVQTYVQSGNVVLSSRKSPARVAGDVEHLLAERFGLEIAVVVRTRDELANVVERDPLGKVAANPKLYQVTFLPDEPDGDAVAKLEALATGGEKLVSSGRELYAWHPNGVGRSKLAARLAARELGGTARNWKTVTTLLAMAQD
jgi:uncharacterized protein (DUF1697 family)